MRTIIVLLFITGVLCAGKSPREHTEIYTKWINGDFNETLFLPTTFIQDETLICQPVTRSSYIQLLQTLNIQCSGSWCIDGEFKCKNNNNCYHVEHIIDMQESLPDVSSMSKNIIGNVIMAYGQWNVQIGNMKWINVEREKRQVYGDKIVDRAIYNIEKCNIVINTNYGDILSYGLLAIVICFIFLVIYGFASNIMSRPPRNTQESEEEL